MGYIRARGLGKAYKRYARKWDRVAEWLGFGQRHCPIWVLQDIDLDIAPGEAVGIVGANGAGKSTLLKLIAGTALPSTGTLEVGGQVSALLELGIGFHPEFTGRHNAEQAAHLAGLSSADIAALLPEIADFADIGDYFDQPFRTYSSGMQARLAFAVATATRPEILIVDEALAVGDIFFQQRCFERMRGFCREGTTLLFVSHALSTVYRLCQRALLLDAGRMIADGSPREIIDLYQAKVIQRADPGDLQVASGTSSMPAGSYTRGDLIFEQVALLRQDQPASALASDQTVTLRIELRFLRALADPHVGFQVRDRHGETLYRTHTHGLGSRIGPVVPGERVRVDYVVHLPLIAGDYSVTVGVADGGLPGGEVERSLARWHDALRFHLLRNPDAPYWDGVCNLTPQCTVSRLPHDEVTDPASL